MRERRIVLGIVLGLVLVLGLGGCFERGESGGKKEQATGDRRPATGDRRPEETEPPGPKDPAAEIRVALEAEPAHLNPLVAADALVARVAMGDIYQGLLCPGETGQPAVPCLAEKVEEDHEGKVWTFEVREGVVWHDGAPFTAADVLFTFGLLRGKDAAPTVLSADFDDLVRVEAKGRQVSLTFRETRMDRREALSRVPILPRHLLEDVRPAELALHRTARAPVGTGPLRLVSWKNAESIELERFDRYWGVPAGAARVTWVIAPSRERALLDVEAGRLDVVLQVPVDQARSAAAGLRAFSYPMPAYLAGVFNLRHPALADADTRYALVMLLDRAAIARDLLGDHSGTAVISAPYPPGDEGVSPEARPDRFDATAAGKLLAGLERRLRLTLLVPAGSTTMARIADIWASDARPYATLEVETAPYAEVLSRARAGRFDIALLSFTTGPNIDLYHRFHSSQVDGENYGAFGEEVMDDLLDEARVARSPEGRKKIRRMIHQRLHALVPYAFIGADRRMGVCRRDVGGAAALGAGGGARRLWRQAR